MPHNGEEEKKKPPEKKPDRTSDIFKAISAAGQFLSNVSPGGGGGVQMIPGQVGGAPQQLARPFPGPGATMPQQVQAPRPGPRAGHPAFQMGTSFPTKQARTGAVVSGAIQNITQAVSRWKGARVAQKKALMSNKVAQLLTAIENNDKETIRAYLTDEKFMKEAEKFVQFSLPDAPKKEAPPEVAGFQDAIIKSSQGGQQGGGQAGGGRVVGGKLLPSPDAAAMLRQRLQKGMFDVAGRSPEAAAQMGGTVAGALLPGAEAVQSAGVAGGTRVSAGQTSAQTQQTSMLTQQQKFAGMQADLDRRFTAKEAGLGRGFAAGEAVKGRTWQASQNSLTRALQRSTQITGIQAEQELQQRDIGGRLEMLLQGHENAKEMMAAYTQSRKELISARETATLSLRKNMLAGRWARAMVDAAKVYSQQAEFNYRNYREFIRLGDEDSEEAQKALSQALYWENKAKNLQTIEDWAASQQLLEMGIDMQQLLSPGPQQ